MNQSSARCQHQCEGNISRILCHRTGRIANQYLSFEGRGHIDVLGPCPKPGDQAHAVRQPGDQRRIDRIHGRRAQHLHSLATRNDVFSRKFPVLLIQSRVITFCQLGVNGLSPATRHHDAGLMS